MRGAESPGWMVWVKLDPLRDYQSKCFFPNSPDVSEKQVRYEVSDLKQFSSFSRGGARPLFALTEKRLQPKFPGFVLISGHDGDDARHYLEKQIRNALSQVEK